MITPLDIQKKSFEKSFRGYKAKEVDVFLDMLTLDMEKLIKENARLKSELESAEGDLTKFKGSEGEVVKVLEQAKQLMDDISKSAEKRAEVMIKNAELDADMILREAKDNAAVLKEENVSLKNRYENFRDRYEKMLQDELAHFRTLTDNMFPEFESDKLEEILAEDTTTVEKPDADATIIMDESVIEEMAKPKEHSGRDTTVLGGSKPDLSKTMVLDINEKGGE